MMLENVIIGICVGYIVLYLLYLRFAPAYISNRSKRYISPKRKGVEQ